MCMVCLGSQKERSAELRYAGAGAADLQSSFAVATFFSARLAV